MAGRKLAERRGRASRTCLLKGDGERKEGWGQSVNQNQPICVPPILRVVIRFAAQCGVWWWAASTRPTKSPLIGQNGRWDLYRGSDRQTPAPPPGQSDPKSKRARAWLLGFAWIDRPTDHPAAPRHSRAAPQPHDGPEQQQRDASKKERSKAPRLGSNQGPRPVNSTRSHAWAVARSRVGLAAPDHVSPQRTHTHQQQKPAGRRRRIARKTNAPCMGRPP